MQMTIDVHFEFAQSESGPWSESTEPSELLFEGNIWHDDKSSCAPDLRRGGGSALFSPRATKQAIRLSK